MQVSHTNICTDDSAEFRAWELAAGIEARRMQLSHGRGIFQADLAVLGDVCIWRYAESQRILTDFALPPGTIELCFVSCPDKLVWCGMELPRSAVAIHLGGQSYRTVLPPHAKSYGIVIPESSRLNTDLVSDDLLDRVRSSGEATALVPESLLDRVVAFFDAFLESNLDSHPDVACDLLLNWCQQVVDECFPGRTTGSQLTKRKLVEDATDLIGSRLQDQLTVQQLLSALGVSRRVLERAFREYLGVTPLQYVYAERLHLARRMLGRNEGSILDVCLESGFSHPSRFAEMYARQFGELPSQTMKRKR